MQNQNKLVVSKLISQKGHKFNLSPRKDTLQEISEKLDVLLLKTLSFSGQIYPINSHDLKLNARLNAVVIQTCGISLEPMKTTLETNVTRIFSRDWDESKLRLDETSMETSIERQKETINLMEILIEELALEIPVYPKSKTYLETSTNSDYWIDEKEVGSGNKPFAILSDLKKKMSAQKDD